MSELKKAFVVHVDGASSGNPGPAGAGVLIATADDGTVVHQEGYYLGRATNNIAEYYALLIALEELIILGAQSAVIHSDSQLLVRQYSGQYKVKAPGLKFVFDRVRRLGAMIDNMKLVYIPREQNKTADGLATGAVKNGRKTGG